MIFNYVISLKKNIQKNIRKISSPNVPEKLLRELKKHERDRVDFIK
jgi:hypothetical protein